MCYDLFFISPNGQLTLESFSKYFRGRPNYECEGNQMDFGMVVLAEEPVRATVRVANDTVYGLAAGIWTRDISKAHRLAETIRAGTVWINCYNVFDAALPFGGYKQSGWGREFGRVGVEAYTEVKSVVVRC